MTPFQVDGSIYVSVKNGAQRVYTCTSDHAKTLYNSPLSYHIEEPQAGEADLTPLAPATQCPFCTMDAVKGHELQFMGNQSIHACSMTRMSTRSGVVCLTKQRLDDCVIVGLQASVLSSDLPIPTRDFFWSRNYCLGYIEPLITRFIF
jgi:hypothetical protein